MGKTWSFQPTTYTAIATMQFPRIKSTTGDRLDLYTFFIEIPDQVPRKKSVYTSSTSSVRG